MTLQEAKDQIMAKYNADNLSLKELDEVAELYAANWKSVVDAQRITLSKQYEIMQLGHAVINRLNDNSEDVAHFNSLWVDFHKIPEGDNSLTSLTNLF